MSKTYKKEFRKNLFSNGHRDHHNTLLREFRGRDLMGGVWLVKDTHNIFDERDCQSDRMKRIRKATGKKRRLYMKKYANEIISEEIF